MIKITPYKISSKSLQGEAGLKNLQSFTAFGNPLVPVDKPSIVASSIQSDKFEKMQFAPEWLKDETIIKAVNCLSDVEFDKNDIKVMQSQGAMLPFLSGKEAIMFIKNSNIRIKFEALSSPHIHAQYDFEDNFIKINEIYKGTQDPAEILAIAEAIFHEAGHAQDGDGSSSIQEEIDCLSLNALSHRYFVKKIPDIFTNTDALIVKDGVCVYADLFFEQDSTKTGLINRIKQKYGFLPVGDFKHPPSSLALKVKTT